MSGPTRPFTDPDHKNSRTEDRRPGSKEIEVHTISLGSMNRVEEGRAATAAYVDHAAPHGLDPARMALAYVLVRPFLAAAIIGATTMTQLANNMAAKDWFYPKRS